ncbi:hypothetical protein [Jeongeupia sp. USM3]|uniref:hypothetical protein n=1 Tax=Jeongeupia sp. USM3 TaxID=1906741 RepID=UPI00089DF162|nr:hypothetical protein [Jeongeupia sp. USM3]AOY00245.1 hypothetical protein BJP62_07175 [Jeongeupia sp. USM3]
MHLNTQADRLAAATVYAVLVIWIGEWLFGLVTGRGFGSADDAGPRLVRTLLVFLPFGLFWLLAHWRSWADDDPAAGLAWRTGFACSALLWACYYYDGLFHAGGGANIGLGLLLMISPLPILIVMWLAHALAARWRR